jgi:hypothetical protein
LALCEEHLTENRSVPKTSKVRNQASKFGNKHGTLSFVSKTQVFVVIGDYRIALVPIG